MKVRNWEKHQHFKDRRPPWIKLYREVLEQRDINLISDCSFRVLIGLWLLASDDPLLQGNLPSIEDISFKLRIEKSKLIKCLDELKDFLIQDDIKPISPRYQDDAPEERREEAEKKPKLSTPFDSFWSIYPRKVSKDSSRKAFEKALKNGATLERLISSVNAYCKTSQWQEALKTKERTFIPHASTWLNEKRWEDEICSTLSNDKDDFVPCRGVI